MTTTDTAPPRELREYRELTQAELHAEARARFGPDHLDIAFVCPTCGDVATGRDFPEGEYARLGQECIGRLLPKRGCKATAYGFFKGPWTVVMPDGRRVASFPLAPAPPQPPHSAQRTPDRPEGHASARSAPEATVRPEAPGSYWTAEHGWRDDASGIGCACHITAPCAACESLTECEHCPTEVLVPEDDMAAHLHDVHGIESEA